MVRSPNRVRQIYVITAKRQYTSQTHGKRTGVDFINTIPKKITAVRVCCYLCRDGALPARVRMSLSGVDEMRPEYRHAHGKGVFKFPSLAVFIFFEYCAINSYYKWCEYLLSHRKMYIYNNNVTDNIQFTMTDILRFISIWKQEVKFNLLLLIVIWELCESCYRIAIVNLALRYQIPFELLT